MKKSRNKDHAKISESMLKYSKGIADVLRNSVLNSGLKTVPGSTMIMHTNNKMTMIFKQCTAICFCSLFLDLPIRKLRVRAQLTPDYYTGVTFFFGVQKQCMCVYMYLPGLICELE